jgi:hypothetical protein
VEQEDEDATEDLEVQSPVSISSHKRASGISTIGSSPALR